MIRLGGTAVLAITAWAVLLAGAPAGLSWLCGADGLVSSIPPWDIARLGALGVMWAAMMAAMLLPCLVLRMGLTPHPPFGHLLPQGEKVDTRPTLPWGTRPAASSTVLTLAAALLHWSLESTGLLGTPEIATLLSVAIVLAEFRKWTAPAGALLPTLQMVALQLLVDPMSVNWMAVVMLWMMSDLLLPDRTQVLAGIWRLLRRVNCVLAEFGLSRSH